MQPVACGSKFASNDPGARELPADRGAGAGGGRAEPARPLVSCASQCRDDGIAVVIGATSGTFDDPQVLDDIVTGTKHEDRDCPVTVVGDLLILLENGGDLRDRLVGVGVGKRGRRTNLLYEVRDLIRALRSRARGTSAVRVCGNVA
jgi:hypothetical protein